MAKDPPEHPKRHALRQRRTLNPHPEKVRDPLFHQDPFFDPDDLVQVKYEMLRRVQREAQPITDACATFGFSRPSFYQAQAAFTREGLPGLLPKRRGPHAAHKLSEEVLAFVDQHLAEDPTLAWSAIAQRIAQRFAITVHPRTLQRARAKKKRP